MITSIEIHGLRGIEDGKLDDLTPLTVIVGPNGSGKSTILDALFLAANPVLGEAIEALATSRARIDHEPEWLLRDQTRLAAASVMVTTDEAGTSRTVQLGRSLPFGTSANGDPGVEFEVLSATGGHTGESGGRIGRSSLSPGPRDWKPLSGVAEIRLVDLASRPAQPLDVLYDDAMRLGRRIEAQSIVSGVLPGVTLVEIGLSSDRTPRLVAVYDDRMSVPLALAGEGAQTLARVALELAARQHGTVLVEEPEVHLHPGAIRKVAQVIWAAVRRDIQVILTTHSLELIDSLLSESADDDLSKLSVYRTQLRDGCLKTSRLPGESVLRLRTSIEEDLR